jgi:cytochrome c553
MGKRYFQYSSLIGWAVALAAAPGFTSKGQPAGPSAESIEFFESKIRPVLVEKCYSCHSADSKKLKGDLKVDSAGGLLRGGESGSPSVVPGQPDKSKLIEAIAYKNEDLQMPPKEKLPADVVANFEAWIKMGAPDPRQTAAPVITGASHLDIAAAKRDWWSFKAPQAHAPPSVKDGKWVKTPVDAFVLAKLEEKSLAPSAPADRRTLIRRAAYDLTGLPPTPEEVRAFEADQSPDAFAKVVDRLLASPHYGERWGRYWLDVCRYADSKGYVFQEERRYPFAYTFRDWVVRSFNEDLPYDQFVIDQLAADKLPLGDDKRPLAAMGFLTVGRRFLNNQADIIDDRLDVVGRGLMGLTVACARCHDHKFDPIPTKDYYSLYGVFQSSTEPKDLPEINNSKSPETAAYEAERAKLQAAVDAYRQAKVTEIIADVRTAKSVSAYLLATHEDARNPGQEVERKRNLRRKVLERWKQVLKNGASDGDPIFAAWNILSKLPDAEFAGKVEAATKACTNPVVQSALMAKPPKTLKDLADVYGEVLATYAKPQVLPDAHQEAIRKVLYAEASPANLSAADTMGVFNRKEMDDERNLRNKIDALAVTHPGSPARAMVMVDLPQPQQPHVFKRGNQATPGEAVPRQFLAVVSPEPRQPFKEGSGRLELARSIASKENPLTARVMVNRVWAHHFGYGLVRTPSDFGRRGELPTHPELLDDLAVKFVDGGWSVKKLHRLIMLSATYQQASNDTAAGRAADPENRLLWRMNRQRLDFESTRDSLLAVSGGIDLTVGGRPVDLLATPFTKRRTVYGFIDRQNLPNVFRAFDFASPDSHSPQRYFTTVPQQALYMMNSPFVLETARAIAARPEIAGEKDTAKKVEKLYRIVLDRSPSKDEMEIGLGFVNGEAAMAASTQPSQMNVWEKYAQVLLETNEFAFVD